MKRTRRTKRASAKRNPTLKILGIEYRVTHPKWIKDDNGDRSNWLGAHTASKGLIEIRSGMCKEEQALTLWHEVLHGISHQLDLRLTERQVSALTPVIIQAMRDNRELRTECHRANTSKRSKRR